MPGSTRPASFTDTAMLVRAFQVARMLHVAATLGIADRVDGRPVPAAELAAACGADAAMLLRLCRALAAFGVFAVDEAGNVRQTERSSWLREAAEPTLHHAARYWGEASTWATWGNLEHTIRTGEPAFKAIFGMPPFEYLRSHPEKAALFDSFMQHSPDDRHNAVAEAYPFAGLVVDVGGGNGALLAAVLAAHPQARGLLYDREAVVSRAGATLASHPGRCRVEAGDFFEAVPAGGDLYTLSQILHDWSDARCLDILANCGRAIRPGGRLLVIERLLQDPSGHTDPMNYLADMHMMVLFPGARERTTTEFERMLGAGGFELLRVVPTRSPFHVLEARPAPKAGR
jgi:hypothetical protein